MAAKKDRLVAPFRELNGGPAQSPLLKALYRQATGGEQHGPLRVLRLDQLVDAAARDAAHRDPDRLLDQQRTRKDYFELFTKLEAAKWGSLIRGRRGQPTRFVFSEKFVAADLARVFAVLGFEPGSFEKQARSPTFGAGTPSDIAFRSKPHQALRRDDVVSLLRAHEADIRGLGVSELSLFGSLARDEARAESDVDFLVAFDGPVTSERFFDTKFFLEDLLGKRIDLVTDSALRERARRELEPELIRVA